MQQCDEHVWGGPSARTWANGGHNAGAVAARIPGVAGVHAQDVEHVAEVEPHRAHRHLTQALTFKCQYWID